jgi:hypothetical protein
MYFEIVPGSASSSSYSRNGRPSTSTSVCRPGILSDIAIVGHANVYESATCVRVERDHDDDMQGYGLVVRYAVG